MKRRDFITFLGGAAVTYPFAARAQQQAVPIIGSLNGVSPTQWAIYMAGFRKGLSQMGYVEGQNVMIEYRWAEGHYDRLPAMAADLLDRKVTVIFAGGGVAVATAAKAATSTIPIVFTIGGDPVGEGLVASMNRPGGNITGVSHLSGALAPKRLEMLSELVPKARVFALIANPDDAADQSESKEFQSAATARGQIVHLLSAKTEGDIERAFDEIVTQKSDALLISSDAFFNSQRDRLVAGAARLAIPTIYSWREYVDRGGLMSYGASISDQYRLAGILVGRVLNGGKPADLPIMQPTKFELVINLKTARALGLDVPPTLLVPADEVIE